MREVADDVFQLRGFPPNAINVYLAGGVIFDASTRWAGPRILRQVRGHSVSAHALTHAHPDHQGASRRICRELGIPLLCGAGDVHAMQTKGAIREAQPDHWLNGFSEKVWTGPPHTVDRVLHEGDDVAGFRVLEVPGHSAGHVAFWRESDRVLILGDVLNNQHLLTGMPGLRTPPGFFTPDPVRNRESARRLGELEPAVACFGHGRVLRDPSKFARFTASLPV